MTQEEKELLLKDLCARLPYGVKVKLGDNPNIFDLEYRIKFAVMYGNSDKLEDILDITNIKPYLFPLSSMTEEQHTDMFNYYHNAEIEEVYASGDFLKAAYIGDDKKYEWLNRNHFDYRGLIEKGVAVDATGLNIY